MLVSVISGTLCKFGYDWSFRYGVTASEKDAHEQLYNANHGAFDEIMTLTPVPPQDSSLLTHMVTELRKYSVHNNNNRADEIE